MATFRKIRTRFMNRNTGKPFLRLHHPVTERWSLPFFSHWIARRKKAIFGGMPALSRAPDDAVHVV